ncbi:M23 family metallopeptidase [Nocardioides daejeonensis]|uniref:M23 family metallopeptidase n=1 Tax=Nocardioides daejeonensis TaxID=1046556 RepID=UPI001951F148|nr:M23 family metallopeptidase [Nocardioides daejeonensis]
MTDQEQGHSCMGNHRAPRRGITTTVRRATPAATSGGKRKAVKHAAPRSFVLRGAPSASVLLGLAALTVSATGAVTMGGAGVAAGDDTKPTFTLQANALSGLSAVSSTTAREQRSQTISRDSRRDALEDASSQELVAAAEAQVAERNGELAKLAESANKHASKVAMNLWHLPVVGYRLTARFGQSSGLWAHNHTGLDFAAPSGTPVMSVTNGTVTSVGYEGAYGNQIIVTTDDGTELWYCHLSAYGVQVGDTVTSGQVIGAVGSTGNSTGPHMHLEVRPGAGDPIDPYAALRANGVQP